MSKAYKQPFPIKSLHQLLQEHGLVTQTNITSLADALASGIQTDSRQVKETDVFIAYRGVARDSHQFLAQVLAEKPRLVIVEEQSFLPQNTSTPWIAVSDARAAWSLACALLYGMPQEALDFYGVTGTNGKTSTVWILRQLLAKQDISTLSIGTLGVWLGDEFKESAHTTPDPPILFSLLAEAKAKGIRHCLMEVSSQAVIHGRIAPLKFKGAGFTSFSRDHLDLHGDMQSYWQAKCRLFSHHLTADARMAVHGELAERIPNDLRSKDFWTYGHAATAAGNSHAAVDYGEPLTLQFFAKGMAPASECGRISFLGKHGSDNFCLAMLLNHKITGSWFSGEKWPDLPQIPGRLELVPSTSDKRVLVDYAHTPDALAKTLAAVRQFTNGKLVVVFGCGGDRDRGKRAEMGAVASELADEIILTSDNPRSEDPRQIVSDIESGVQGKTPLIELDRRQAIAQGIARLSAASDSLVIAGKGHENYQIIGEKVLAFNDQAVAKEVLGS